MISIKKIWPFVFLITIFIGCKKIIDYDRNSVSQTLVLSAVIKDREIIDIRLSKTTNRFDTVGYETDNSKKVLVYENGIFFCELRNTASRGRYVSETDKTATAGNEYKLDIYDEDETLVAFAKTFLPKHISFEMDTVSKYIDGKRRLLVTLKFDEPGESEDYYRLELYDSFVIPVIDSNKDIGVQIFSIPATMNIDHSWLIKGMGFFNENDQFHDWAENIFYIFSDRYLQGKKAAFEIDMPYFMTDSILGTLRTIMLQSISKDYFYYLRTAMQQNSIGQNPFNEQVQIYSNVENGIGFLGGFSYTTDSLFHINRHIVDSLRVLYPDIKIPPELEKYFNSTASVGSGNLQQLR